MSSADTHSQHSAGAMEMGCPMSEPCAAEVTYGGEPCAAEMTYGGEPIENGDEGSQGSVVAKPNILNRIMPPGGLLATGFAMASTVIGAGVLGLPAAYSNVGWVMGTLYLFLITVETVYSMRMVLIVSEKTGLLSFEQMASRLIHPGGLYFVALIRFIHSFGAQIAYVVTIGNLCSPVLESAGATGFFSGDNEWGLRVLTIIFWVVLFLPVALPREVNALRYVSTVGLAFILFFCICIIVHSAMGTRGPHVRPVVTGNEAVGGLGTFIFSYMVQVNVMDCVREMTSCTMRRFTITSTISMAFCGTLYFLTGLFGYLEFGEDVKGSILEMFQPLDEYQFLISYIGILIKICASYGLLSNSARSAAYAVIGWDPLTVDIKKHLAFAFSMAVVSLLAGLFIPDINMVFGFVGGVCGGFIAFIFPALFYMYAGDFSPRSVGWVNYICTYVTLAAGVVAIVFGTAYTIYDVLPED